MSELVWIGGGNNRTNNPADWVDPTTGQHRTPRAGDTLLDSPTTGYSWKSPSAGVTNIHGNELAGTSINFAWQSGSIVNLSQQASVSGWYSFGAGTVNVDQWSTLDLSLSHGSPTINLDNSSLVLHPGYGIATVNVTGNSSISVSLPGGQVGETIVNIASGSILSGTVGGNLDIKGGAGSMFINDGDSHPAYATVDASVFGHGTWTVSSKLEFGGFVDANQTVEDNGILQIDQLREFLGTVDLGNLNAQVLLKNIGQVDGYDLRGDLLYLFNGNQIVDTLHIKSASQFGLWVSEVPGSGTVLLQSSNGNASSRPNFTQGPIDPHTT